MMTESILVALITGGFAYLGVYTANRKSAALIEYRLTELEKTVKKHNNFDSRLNEVEKQSELQEAEVKRLRERIKELEDRHAKEEK